MIVVDVFTSASSFAIVLIFVSFRVVFVVEAHIVQRRSLKVLHSFMVAIGYFVEGVYCLPAFLGVVGLVSCLFMILSERGSRLEY